MFNLFKKNKSVSKEVAEKINSNATEILIRYSYEFLDDVPQNERVACNAFCEKMMELSKTKFWSRSDIEQISEIMGYSVWDRRGFWIDKGDLDENGEPIEYRYIKDGVEQEHCKHQWKSNIVKKK